jgi:hypothetical protein
VVKAIEDFAVCGAAISRRGCRPRPAHRNERGLVCLIISLPTEPVSSASGLGSAALCVLAISATTFSAIMGARQCW